MSEENKTSKKNWKQIGEYCFYASIVIMAAVGALNNEWRSQLRASLFPEYRKVLRTVAGEIFGNGTLYKVVKIQTRDELYVEVYGQSESGSRPLFARFALPDPIDAFFHVYSDVNQQATNLALKDIDNDGQMEILAPSSAKDAVVRLNVYRFNSDSRQFELVTQ